MDNDIKTWIYDIIHGYDKISDDLIWSIVMNHLPKLKDEVTGLLNE
jgi:uncharacterized protein with HEPN domain